MIIANTWVDKKEPSFYLYRQTDYQVIMRSDNNSPGEAVGWYVVGGMHNQTITINKTSTVIIQIRVPLHNPSNTFGGTGESELHFGLDDASNNYLEFDIATLDVVDGATGQAIAFGYRSNMAPGTYHTHVKIERFLTEDMAMGGYYIGADQGSLMIQIIPQ